MSDTGDMPELEELEPMEAAPAPGPAQPTGPSPVVMYSGLPAPFYNPSASKEWYRFLFAGVLMVVGTLMPFGPEWEMAGYKTMTGGFFLIIGCGLIWTAWGAISIGRPPSMKWIGLAMLPFIWGIFKLSYAWDEPAVKQFVAGGGQIVKDWGELFSTLVDRSDEFRGLKIGNFFRYFGTGKFFVFLGAALVEIYFVLGIFGGAKQIKQAKAARAAGGRRR